MTARRAAARRRAGRPAARRRRSGLDRSRRSALEPVQWCDRGPAAIRPRGEEERLPGAGVAGRARPGDPVGVRGHGGEAGRLIGKRVEDLRAAGGEHGRVRGERRRLEGGERGARQEAGGRRPAELRARDQPAARRQACDRHAAHRCAGAEAERPPSRASAGRRGAQRGQGEALAVEGRADEPDRDAAARPGGQPGERLPEQAAEVEGACLERRQIGREAKQRRVAAREAGDDRIAGRVDRDRGEPDAGLRIGGADHGRGADGAVAAVDDRDRHRGSAARGSRRPPRSRCRARPRGRAGSRRRAR